MAITKIWSFYNSVDATVDYVSQDKKTKVEAAKEPEIRINDLNNELKYIGQDKKTEEKRYISGINCNPNMAVTQMIEVKKLHHKEDGCLGFHCVQSFAPGEIDPDKAHEIGIELANELWGSKGYQVVVATHIDREHIHNHIVINSVNMFDGNKDPVMYHKIIARQSDILIAKHGYSIVNNPGANPAKLPRLSRRQQETKLLIDSIVSQVNTKEDFIAMANYYGYEIDADDNRKYWSIKHEDWQRPMRMIRLGEEYSNEGLMKMITSEMPLSITNLTPRQEYQVNDHYNRLVKWKDTVQYKYFISMYRLGFDLRKYKIKIPKPTAAQKAEFNKHLKRISYLTTHKLTSGVEVKQQLTVLVHKEKFLKRSRNKIRNEIRKAVANGLAFDDLNEKLQAINLELEELLEELEIVREIDSQNEIDPDKAHEIEKEKGDDADVDVDNTVY